MVEDNFWLKATFGGGQPSVEDDPPWKMTFSGRRPLVEDGLRRKTTFSGREPSVGDNLWWKTTFCGRQPSVEDSLRQGKLERQSQGKINVRLKQSNQKHNHNLMGFDTIEINLVKSIGVYTVIFMSVP